MTSELYEWIFWIIIGASAILGFIAIQLLLSSLAEKGKRKGKDKTNTDSIE